MAFVERRLQAQISLAQSGTTGQQTTFDGTQSNTATLKNLRMNALIAHAGLMDCVMSLQIYGMQSSLMNQLSTLGMQISLVPRNPIILSAYNEGENPATVFSGYITAAYADYNRQPSVPFVIAASCGLPLGVAKADPTSFQGTAQVTNIMSSLATKMGLKFENNGVTETLRNPYYSGSYRDQMRACADAAGINAAIVPESQTLAIWPKNGSRGGQIIEIGPGQGMIGYPSYTAYGIALKSVFNPSINFGQKIKVNSSLPAASGEWAIYGMDHQLDSEDPAGKWESNILAYNPKFPAPVAR